jgi:hypothetical protein
MDEALWFPFGPKAALVCGVGASRGWSGRLMADEMAISTHEKSSTAALLRRT